MVYVVAAAMLLKKKRIFVATNNNAAKDINNICFEFTQRINNSVKKKYDVLHEIKKALSTLNMFIH